MDVRRSYRDFPPEAAIRRHHVTIVCTPPFTLAKLELVLAAARREQVPDDAIMSWGSVSIDFHWSHPLLEP